MLRGQIFLCVAAVSFASPAFADPLSKKSDIDFFRDVPSRNLKGLATRSDGRLVSGPTLAEIDAPAPASLLWSLEPTADPSHFLIGTGPDGRIIEITLDAEKNTYATREVAKLDDPQVFALKRLADGSILAGTSPKGALYLLRDDKPVARALLPVDSIFDLLVLDEGTALVATGNPGRIYRIDLKKFATIGLVADKMTDPKILADRGIVLFGEIRDRNVRRIAALPDGRIAAGSSPKGNIYLFSPQDKAAAEARPSDRSRPAAGLKPDANESPFKIAPVILQENRDAEVTDLLPLPNGDLYATVVFSSTSGEGRITPASSAAKSARENKEDPPPLMQVERFPGRSSLVLFPAGGFPETLASRASTAFYRMARHGDLVLLAGGEQGELAGYDPKARLSLTFAGSISAQLNGMVPLAGAPGRFLILRNNAPGLAVLDFNATGPREAETRRLDLGTLSRVGALRFNRLRNVTEADLAPELRTSNGSDEVEGWSKWTALQPGSDGGWRAGGLRGRYAKLRLRLPGANGTSNPKPGAGIEIDRAALFALAQNRRPVLQDFRVLTPGFAVLLAAESTPSPVSSLNQIIQPPKEDDRRKTNFLSSQVVPSPGTQVVLWTITDPDADTFTCNFSIRRDGDASWTEIAAATKKSYAQFDTAHLPDGVYFTRLIATETAPRPPGDRLSQTFETDDMIVDHTPPELVEATARRTNEAVIVTVRGRDKLSLLDGIEVVFNNGVRETVEQPADGIRDGREETFTLDVPLARVSNATSLEVTLYDAAGNSSARRLKW